MKEQQCPYCGEKELGRGALWEASSTEEKLSATLEEIQCHGCGMAFWLPIPE